MHLLTAAALAAGQKIDQPLPTQLLVTQFVVVFIIAMSYTIIKARAKGVKSPVKLGVVLGCLTSFLAVAITIFVMIVSRM